MGVNKNSLILYLEGYYENRIYHKKKTNNHKIFLHSPYPK